jgi:hypothetical protein
MPRLELNIEADQADQADPDGGSDGASARGTGVQVSGTVVGPDGAEATFVGWLGLLAVLQRAVGVPHAAPRPVDRSPR